MFTLYKIPFRGVSCINSMNSNSPGWHKSFTYIKHRAGTVGYERRSRSSKRSRKSECDLVKIKNQSRKRSHKRDGIGVRRIRTFPFSSDSAYDSVVYELVKTRLSEAEAEG